MKASNWELHASTLDGFLLADMLFFKTTLLYHPLLIYYLHRAHAMNAFILHNKDTVRKISLHVLAFTSTFSFINYFIVEARRRFFYSRTWSSFGFFFFFFDAVSLFYPFSVDGCLSVRASLEQWSNPWTPSIGRPKGSDDNHDMMNIQTTNRKRLKSIRDVVAWVLSAAEYHLQYLAWNGKKGSWVPH